MRGIGTQAFAKGTSVTRHLGFGRTWTTLLFAGVLLVLVGGCNARLWAPLHAAAKQNDDKKIREMVAKGADPNSDKIRGNRTPLWIAVKYSKYRSVKALLECGADPNLGRGTKEITPFMAACSIGNYEIVREMLRHGADPNLATASGSTALHYAASRDRGAIITLLLQSKADKNAIDGNGHKPLDLAISAGHANAVVALGGQL